MCEQCLAKAVLVKEYVLPGFSLMQATVGSPNWPKDFFGLVNINDPLFVFEGPIVSDPCFGMTDDDLDAMLSFPDGYDEYEAFTTKLKDAMENTELSPLQAHGFIKACMQAGYDSNEYGDPQWWLGHHLATQLTGNAAIPGAKVTGVNPINMVFEANAAMVKKDVISDYNLMRAERHTPNWPLGHYGLVGYTGLLATFAGPLVADPCFGFTKEQFDALPKLPESYAEFEAFTAELGSVLKLPPEIGFDFYHKCMYMGYTPAVHGSLERWLAHLLASQAGTNAAT